MKALGFEAFVGQNVHSTYDTGLTAGAHGTLILTWNLGVMDDGGWDRRQAGRQSVLLIISTYVCAIDEGMRLGFEFVSPASY